MIATKAREAYETKEAEFPVMAGLIHFTTRDASGQKRYDRDQLVNWSRDRFHVDLDLDDLKNKQQDEIRGVLVEHSRANLGQTSETHRQIEQLVSAVFADAAGVLVEHSRANLGQTSETHRQIEQLVSAVFADAASDHAERNGAPLYGAGGFGHNLARQSIGTSTYRKTQSLRPAISGGTNRGLGSRTFANAGSAGGR